MKISNSKKELARIISENGGWRDGAEFSAIEMHNGDVWFCKEKPEYAVGVGIFSFKDFAGIIEGKFAFPNWHQCILSREEYFHLYPAPDAKAEFCESVTRSIQEPETKPSIESLAADYRNRKDYADRKQREADAANAEAEAKLAELVAAGKAIGLVISVEEKEPELVITNWRDLRVGDEIEVVKSKKPAREGEVGVVSRFDKTDDLQPVRVIFGGNERCYDWPTEWRFIRRPAK